MGEVCGALKRPVLARRGGCRRMATARRCETSVVPRGGNRRSWSCIGVGIGADRRRAQRGVAWRWWAGWPASPLMSRRMRWFLGRFWTAPTPIRSKWGCELSPRRVVGMRAATTPRHVMAHRAATNARDGDTRCHQGAYRGRGCPESPHTASCRSRRRWRCRPARPPTHRNTPLRAVPPRSYPTPLSQQRPPIPAQTNRFKRIWCHLEHLVMCGLCRR
jgi:hypothetical protein